MTVLRTEQLTKWYGSSRGVLDLDIVVEEGEVFGFLGPNGAGKSTTIRLLLDLIRKQEIDIYDIPIGRITREFLEYIRLMQLFDLELAGEFLVMASSLMQIKVRMLLPKEVNEQGEELPGEDPRAELVKQLLQIGRAHV